MHTHTHTHTHKVAQMLAPARNTAPKWPREQAIPKSESILLRQFVDAILKKDEKDACKRLAAVGMTAKICNLRLCPKCGKLVYNLKMDKGVSCRERHDHDTERRPTMLMLAAEKGLSTLVAALLRSGVDPNQRDGHIYTMSTALMYACTQGNLECMKALVTQGADVDLAEQNDAHYDYSDLNPQATGRTPLIIAAQLGHRSVVQHTYMHTYIHTHIHTYNNHLS